MIILSVGMPRAGSGWYYNLTNDLIVKTGNQDAHLIRQKFHLQGILTEVNCNIGALTPRRLLLVLIPSMLGNTFVIKAHAAPTSLARWLIRRNQLRAAYIYRDPRDAMLSAYEYGQRGLARGQVNAFSHLVDFNAALNFMMEYVHISEAWLDMPAVLSTRYENMLDQYDIEADRLVKFFKLDAPGKSRLSNPSQLKSILQEVIDQYQPEEATSDQKGLHFSKGKVGRFREKWTPEQQAILAERFGHYLQRMNYPA
jgi:hypothetical protein